MCKTFQVTLTRVNYSTFYRVAPFAGTQFAGTHLPSWAEKGIVREKCLAQIHNTVNNYRPGVKVD